MDNDDRRREITLSRREKERFQEAIISVFPNIYFTIMSVIQGVAMAVLATKFVSSLNIDDLLGEDNAYLLLYSGLSFFGMIIVTFEYSYYVALVRRPPLISDIAIPFFLGMSQLGPLFFIDNALIWWLLTSIFSLFGSLAYTNTFINITVKPYQYDNNNYQFILGDKETISCTKWHIFLTFSIFSISFSNFVVHLSANNGFMSDSIVVILISALMCAIIYRSKIYLNQLYK